MSAGIFLATLVARLMPPLAIVPEFGLDLRAALASFPGTALGLPKTDHGSLVPVRSGSSN